MSEKGFLGQVLGALRDFVVEVKPRENTVGVEVSNNLPPGVDLASTESFTEEPDPLLADVEQALAAAEDLLGKAAADEQKRKAVFMVLGAKGVTAGQIRALLAAELEKAAEGMELNQLAIQRSQEQTAAVVTELEQQIKTARDLHGAVTAQRSAEITRLQETEQRLRSLEQLLLEESSA